MDVTVIIDLTDTVLICDMLLRSIRFNKYLNVL